MPMLSALDEVNVILIGGGEKRAKVGTPSINDSNPKRPGEKSVGGLRRCSYFKQHERFSGRGAGPTATRRVSGALVRCLQTSTLLAQSAHLMNRGVERQRTTPDNACHVPSRLT